MSGLHIRITLKGSIGLEFRVPSQGFFKGFYKGSVKGFYKGFLKGFFKGFYNKGLSLKGSIRGP